MVIALVLFSGLDASAKYLATAKGLPVAQIVWVRFVVQFVLLLVFVPAFGLLGVKRLFTTSRLPQQLVRSVLMVATTAFNFLALKYLRLDQTITVVFLAPLVVALLAGPVLGEWVGWRRFVAILVGFLGILIVVRPGFTEVHPAIGFAFGAMLAYAIFMLMTRQLAGHDPPLVTLFYSMFVGTLFGAPLAAGDWVAPPDLATWVMLARSASSAGRALPVHPRLWPSARVVDLAVPVPAALDDDGARLSRLRRRAGRLDARRGRRRHRLRRLPGPSGADGRTAASRGARPGLRTSADVTRLLAGALFLAREPRPRLRRPGGETSLRNGRAHRRHEVLVEPRVRPRQQHRAEVLARLDEVMQIGARVVSRRRARALGIERARSSAWQALRRLTLPPQVKASPWRPLRVGSTQSNMSMPRATASMRSTGVPTPIR